MLIFFNRTRPGFYFCSTNKPISTHYLWKCDWTIMIFINLMLVMISFTHVLKVFNNISASSWAKTGKRFQIENRFWLETVGFGSVNLLTTALTETNISSPIPNFILLRYIAECRLNGSNGQANNLKIWTVALYLPHVDLPIEPALSHEFSKTERGNEFGDSAFIW